MRLMMAVLISVLVISVPARSEPVDSIRYLMNEPANMLDIGLQRLRLMLEKLDLIAYGVSNPTSRYVRYDPKTNLINITVLYDQPLPNLNDLACRTIWISIITELGKTDISFIKNNDVLERFYKGVVRSMTWSYFAHEGANTVKMTADETKMEEGILDIINIDIKGSKIDKYDVQCGGMLTNNSPW